MRIESLKLWYLLCALVVAAQLYALGSLPFETPEPWDKVLHALLFAGLALLLWMSLDGRGATVLVSAVILAAAADELRQAAILSRSVDLSDFSAGALAAALTGALLMWNSGARKKCAESSAR